jgi:hypothetical protein
MADRRLASAKDFFNEVVEPNYNDFMRSRSTFRAAFNVSVSLFHMADWVFEHSKASAERALGTTFQARPELWRLVESQVRRAAYIRDVANASKHVRLTHQPSSGLTRIANTYITSVSFQSNAFQNNAFQTGELRIDDNNQAIVFDDCAKDVYDFWKGLITSL